MKEELDINIVLLRSKMDLNDKIIIKIFANLCEENRPHLFILFHNVQRTQFFI